MSMTTQVGAYRRTALASHGCLWVGLALIATLIGCAQTKSYESRGTAKAAVKASRAEGLSASGKYRAVAAGDLDNDGNLDIVGGAGEPGVVSINYGDGKGGLSEPQLLPVKGEVQSIGLADFNEDGLMDIAFSVQRESSGIWLLINQSNRLWKLEKGPVAINKYQGIRTADVNDDGHMDIVAANATSDTQGGIQVWLGTGTGRWSGETGPTVTGMYMDVVVADFNRDGHLDIVGGAWGLYGGLRIWFGDGTGAWSPGDRFAKSNCYGVNVGDLDGDGNPDILAGTFRHGIELFLGDGNGHFNATPSPETKGSFWQVNAALLDDNFVPDLVTGSLDGLGVKAWRRTGSGKWEPFQGEFPLVGIYYGLAVVDLNHDRRDDVCAASYGEGIKIWAGKPETPIAVTPGRAVAQASFAPAGRAPRENDVFVTIDGKAEYKIGPGDVLEITLWEGNSPKKEDILVRPDGRISFGFVEDLLVQGLTVTQLDNLLTRQLAAYVRKPRIDVVVKKYNSKFVTVVGAIASNREGGTGPGKYELTGKSTVLQVLSRAGGPTATADLKNITIRHKDGETASLNLYRAILQGDTSQDVVLDDGDLVYVPALSEEANRVYVFGEVKKPGVFTFSGSQMRLVDAISQAGGATVFAAETETRVVRGDPAKPEIIAANVRSLIEEGDISQNLVLANGDIVYVPRSGVGDVNRFVEQIFPALRTIATATAIVVNFDTINSILSN
jgi:protein involved in polysaccharide export with SLBB domain